jgi:four helix bundle protein
LRVKKIVLDFRHEAQHAESRLDFIHKMKIAAKEAKETAYWLLLYLRSNTYPDCEILMNNVEAKMRLLFSIISKAKQNLKRLKIL